MVSGDYNLRTTVLDQHLGLVLLDLITKNISGISIKLYFKFFHIDKRTQGSDGNSLGEGKQMTHSI